MGLSKAFIGAICEWIKTQDGMDLKRAFRASMILVDIKDQLAEWRVDELLTNMASEMQGNSRFVNATEISLASIVKLPKHFENVQTWWRSKAKKKKGEPVGWMEEWASLKSENKLPRDCVANKPRNTAGTVGFTRSSSGYGYQSNYGSNNNNQNGK